MRISRWAARLFLYNFEVKHKKCRENAAAAEFHALMSKHKRKKNLKALYVT